MIEPATRYRDRDLFMLALRVLSRFMEGEQPTPEVVHRLLVSLPEDMRQLPIDELATAVIRTELAAKEGA